MGRRRVGTATAAEVPGANSDAAQDPRFITALARGIELLRAFKPQDHWLSHRELVARTALPPATVSRLTFTLTALGYLRHRPEAGEYALSPAVLGLGFSMLSNFDIARIARPTLQALAEKCQAAVSMGVRHELEMVYVAHCRSTQRLLLGLDVGARLPFARTSMGQAVLFSAQAAERELLFRRIEAAEGDAWPLVQKRLARAQKQFHTRGFVTSEKEWDPAISAAAVPVDLGDGRTLLGLSVGGPATWLQGSFLHDEVGPMLVQAAASIVSAIQAADWKD
ncbi:helix-turn-helix domain-containing protein [Xylophilus rhododendri]|uniref:Helix-turn-helix domain-containing protein n=1 Tax=Xylophilus rhododendri TaxID=2697032 RepID=A0A857J2N5_9BURK|nr:IclR family transcriptional regulator [Xylophilus rhododendri]QHI98016.1 helix-turn-helix domain-containing protein [Xylophilus rhododendri]